MKTDAVQGGPTPSQRESLSALADGELPAGEAAAAVRLWAAEASLRSQWRDHQVIGDALRSGELAGRGDEAGFLSSLRERLALEPVVLAPTAQASTSAATSPDRKPVSAGLRPQRRTRWAGGAAIAAGFAAVAGVLLSLGNPVSDAPGGATLAGASPVLAPATPQVVAVDWAPGAAGGAATSPAAGGTLGPMIRDPRLDAYLEAHRQLVPGSWMAIPTASTQPRASR